MRSLRFVVVLAFATTVARAQGVADWPRELATAAGTIIVYQPQPETLEGDVLVARAAVCVTRHAASEPRFGAVWFEALLDIDRVERIAYFDSLHVTKTVFADGSLDASNQVARGIEASGAKLSMSLDQLTASLEEGSSGTESRRFRNEPPRILVAQEPTVLVVLDGPEQRRDLGSGILQVVNTPYLLLFDRHASSYYLSDGRTWFEAEDLLGPWRPEARPSKTVLRLADAAAAEQPQTETTATPADGPYTPPRILVSTEPAELIAFDGPPEYAALANGQLLYATNTESDVLIDIAGGRHYVLVAGRWYRSRTLDGPWTFVEPEDLPETFGAIPTDSEKAALRAHVPGTEEARDAVLDSQLPETAAIKRSAATLTVDYDGPPQFAPVSGVRVAYAVNTPYAVLSVGHHYYACHNAMWFVAADPYGPWLLAETVPQEIYSLPPSCPVYSVRYAYIYRVTPEVIYVGYLPGYVGSYVYHGTVIYGTGWVYQPWIGTATYVPRACTWGLHAHYATWSGGWSFGYSDYSGFWDYSIVWGTVHPWWPTPRDPHHFHEYGGWWGPGGYRHDPPRHRRHERDVERSRREVPVTDVYRRPEVASVARPSTMRELARRGVSPAPRPAPETRTPSAAPTLPNDVVVDRSGNVFRRDDSGWKQRLSTGWTATGTERPRAQATSAPPRATPTSPRAASPPAPSGSPHRAVTAPAAPTAPAGTTTPGFRPWASTSKREVSKQKAVPAAPQQAAVQKPTPAGPSTPPPKLEGPRGARELQEHLERRERGTKKEKASGASKN